MLRGGQNSFGLGGEERNPGHIVWSRTLVVLLEVSEGKNFQMEND
jgi:hypothetical protein